MANEISPVKRARLLGKESFVNDFNYDAEGALLPEEVRAFYKVISTTPRNFFIASNDDVYFGQAEKGVLSAAMTNSLGTTWDLDLTAVPTTIDRTQAAKISVFWWDTTNSKFRAVSTDRSEVTKTAFQTVFVDEFIAAAPNALIPGVAYQVRFPTVPASTDFTVKYTRLGVPITALGSGTADGLHPGYYKLFEGVDQVGWFNTEGEFYMDFTLVGAPDEGTDLLASYLCDLITTSSISSTDISVTLNGSYDGGTAYAVWDDSVLNPSVYCGYGVATLTHIINEQGGRAGLRTAKSFETEVRHVGTLAHLHSDEGTSTVVSFFARKVLGSNAKIYVRIYDTNGNVLKFVVPPTIMSGDYQLTNSGTGIGSNDTVEFLLTDKIQRFGVSIPGVPSAKTICIETYSDTGDCGTQQILITSIQSSQGSVLAPYTRPGFLSFIPRPLPTGGDPETVFGKPNEMILSNGMGGVYWGTISGSGLAITTINTLSATSQTLVLATVTTNTDPVVSSSVNTHTFNFLELATEFDVDFDIVGQPGHLTYGTTGFDDSYLQKFGLQTKLWHDRTRQMYEGVFRGVTSYTFYGAQSGVETSLLTQYATIDANATRIVDGTVALPAFSFISDTNMGLYRIGADSLGFSANGTQVGLYASTGAWTLGPASSDAINHQVRGSVFFSTSTGLNSASYRCLGDKCANVLLKTDGSDMHVRAGVYFTGSGNAKAARTDVSGIEVKISGATSDTAGGLSFRKIWDGDYTVAADADMATIVDLVTITPNGAITATTVGDYNHLLTGSPSTTGIVHIVGNGTAGTYIGINEQGIATTYMGFDDGSDVFKIRSTTVTGYVIGQCNAGNWTFGMTVGSPLTHTFRSADITTLTVQSGGSDKAAVLILSSTGTGAGNIYSNKVLNFYTNHATSDVFAGSVSTTGVWSLGVVGTTERSVTVNGTFVVSGGNPTVASYAANQLIINNNAGTSYLVSCGPDGTTYGMFNFYMSASDGAPLAPILTSSTTGSWTFGPVGSTNAVTIGSNSWANGGNDHLVLRADGTASSRIAIRGLLNSTLRFFIGCSNTNGDLITGDTAGDLLITASGRAINFSGSGSAIHGSCSSAGVWVFGPTTNDKMLVVQGYGKFVSAVPTLGALPVGGTQTINCHQQHIFRFSAPASGTTTINLDGLPGNSYIERLSEGQTVNIYIAAGGGSYLLNFNPTVYWPVSGKPGSAGNPASTTVGKMDVYTFIKIGGNIYGTCIMGMTAQA